MGQQVRKGTLVPGEGLALSGRAICSSDRKPYGNSGEVFMEGCGVLCFSLLCHPVYLSLSQSGAQSIRKGRYGPSCSPQFTKLLALCSLARPCHAT